MVEVELTGTASFSTRRGKSFIFFEFAISCKWEGELVNEDGDVTGTGEGGEAAQRSVRVPSRDHVF